ncbi:MAG: 5'-methylthioadenosine/adenosylhomocysteine nucleosidase [Lachnospiraceae bacterium]|nr:5'-methylthioadenosine/adenosylhomocysteine nucleosidase [Lachnospiraceae bacterium]
MVIGIIGAMDEEVSRLKDAMTDTAIISKASMDFYKGVLCGKNVVVVKSGIGKVNAAVCTQILADEFQVGAIINTGIAGSLNNDINIGDIVLSTDTLQHDVDAVAFGYEPGQIPRMDVLSFPADEKLIDSAYNACKNACSDIGVFKGRVVSGDQFVADNSVKHKIKSQFGGFCTEMEGAAIGQAAYLNNVPYIVVRAISDKADDSASQDYPAFEKKSHS